MIDPPLQWKLVRADLNPVRGSEQAGVRPVLIVSSDSVNDVLSIVSVLPLTTRKPGRTVYPTEALLAASIAGQPNESIVMAHQIRSLSKERLSHEYGILEDESVRESVREAMRNHLDLAEGLPAPAPEAMSP